MELLMERPTESCILRLLKLEWPIKCFTVSSRVSLSPALIVDSNSMLEMALNVLENCGHAIGEFIP